MFPLICPRSTGCPNKHGNQMTTSISSLFQAGLFCKHYFLESQLKHLTPKTTSLGISKMWSFIFSPLKLAEKLGNLSRFQFIKNQQNYSNV